MDGDALAFVVSHGLGVHSDPERDASGDSTTTTTTSSHRHCPLIVRVVKGDDGKGVRHRSRSSARDVRGSAGGEERRGATAELRMHVRHSQNAKPSTETECNLRERCE